MIASFAAVYTGAVHYLLAWHSYFWKRCLGAYYIIALFVTAFIQGLHFCRGGAHLKLLKSNVFLSGKQNYFFILHAG